MSTEHIRRFMLSNNLASRTLLDYIDERIGEIVSDKLSQCAGDVEEKLREDLTHEIKKELRRQS